MTKKSLFSQQILFAITVFLFGVLATHYTGNRGIYPIDSFGHFDSGYRILNGEHPFRDYWIVSGFFIDYLQSVIFYLFGINWQTYLLNASLLNGTVSVLFYLLLINLGLSFKISFFYAICFSILAYPSSGTPFVDHHSTLLSLTAIIMYLNAISSGKKIFWVLIPTFLFFAFLSKQVPASYTFLTLIFLIIFHLTQQKKREIVKIVFPLFLTSIILVGCLIIFFKILGIEEKYFLTQYFFYPSLIGEERYENISYNFKNFFLNFKFIHLSLLFLIYLTFLNLSKKNFYKNINFKILVTCVLTFLSLAHHIIFTKNQIFIFFLVPFILGFVNIQLNNSTLKYKKYFNIILITFCIVITLKYHQRFNIERKFHELNNVEFNKAKDATGLSEKFMGLKWISPESINKKFLISEIDFLIKFKNMLTADESKKIVLTNYSFFSIITQENVSGYSRWYTRDGSAFPVEENKYVQNYKDLIISVLKRKKIKNIYILPDVKEKNVLNYLNAKCFDRIQLELGIIKYEINNKCDDLFVLKKK